MRESSRKAKLLRTQFKFLAAQVKWLENVAQETEFTLNYQGVLVSGIWVKDFAPYVYELDLLHPVLLIREAQVPRKKSVLSDQEWKHASCWKLLIVCNMDARTAENASNDVSL